MIEQGIYFALGCVVTGLFALGFAPIFWRRALRLSQQRLQVQIPVSMQEILADRDQLRAEFAIERRKLEQAVERVRAGKAQDMSELGRRAADLATLDESLAAAQDLGRRQAQELARQSREAEEINAERGALQIALHDATVALDQRATTLRALQADHDRLNAEADEDRTTIAALDTRAMGLEMRIEDAAHARIVIDQMLVQTRREVKRLGDERDHLTSQVALLQDDHDGLRRRLDQEAANLTSTERAHLALETKLDQGRHRIRDLEHQLATADQAAAAAKEREKAIHLQRSMQAEKVRGEGRATLDRIETLQTEVAALRGALEAARRRTSSTDMMSTPSDIDSDAVLRIAIHELGLAVATMTTNPDRQPNASSA